MANKFILSTFIVLFASSLVFSDDNIEICKPDEELHTKCLYPVVLLENETFLKDKSIGKTYGSAVVVVSKKINDEYWNVALTAAHVVDSRRTTAFHPGAVAKHTAKVALYKEWSTFVGYEDYSAHVYQIESHTDLAIIFFRTQRMLHTAEIAEDPKLFIGTDVIRIGCGLGDEPRLDCGKVSSLEPGFEGVKGKGQTRLTVPTVPGDSGGGIFCNYKLVGIMSSIRAMGNLPVFNISFMSRINNIIAWNKVKNNRLEFVYEREPIPYIASKRMWFDDQKLNKNSWGSFSITNEFFH